MSHLTDALDKLAFNHTALQDCAGAVSIGNLDDCRDLLIKLARLERDVSSAKAELKYHIANLAFAERRK